MRSSSYASLASIVVRSGSLLDALSPKLVRSTAIPFQTPIIRRSHSSTRPSISFGIDGAKSLRCPSFVRPQVARRINTSSRARQELPAIGGEPGIDTSIPTSTSTAGDASFGNESDIRIIDYSDEQLAQHNVSPESLETFLADQPKPSWAACRWIYVNGIHLDTVRCLGNHKGLHPLAVEDIMDTGTPTKVDWYDDHAFLEMNLAKLITHDEYHRKVTKDDDRAAPLRDRYGSQRRPKHRILSPGKFGMSVEQVSMFLTSDKTVITIFQLSGNDIYTPIMARLQSSKTVIRSSNDPSMLMQAVIDATVDLALPIGRAVGEAFDELETSVLTAPRMEQSKQLHILRSGLTLIAEHTISLTGLIRTLCDHRAVADLPKTADNAVLGPEATVPAKLATSVQISPLTQVYLQDVQDHLTSLSNSTRMSIRSAENLTSLIFNTITASQNESVRKLTLVSSFFLPLTFLTGYMGMNFETMPIVNEHSDAYFWLIATPVMMTTLLLLVPRGTWSAPMRRFRRWRARRKA